MKTLLLLRHAKSDWDAPYEGDHQRPLAPRGIRAARQIGSFLGGGRWEPELCRTSSAVRARETVRLAVAAGHWQCPVEVEEAFYGASPPEMEEAIRALPNGHRTVLLAGHEPTWSALASRLIGGGRLRFPTAAVACIRWPVESWERTASTPGELRWLVTPKLLGESPPR